MSLRRAPGALPLSGSRGCPNTRVTGLPPTFVVSPTTGGTAEAEEPLAVLLLAHIRAAIWCHSALM